MPRVTFVQPDGSQRSVDAPVGQSLMQAALFNDIRGILADCGGNTSCGTCHVWLGLPWTDKLPPIGIHERLVLDSVANQTGESRLSCCIQLSDALEGLVARLPAP